MKYRKIFWVGWVASLILFLAPISAMDSTGLGMDKVAHVVLFAFLGTLAYRAYPKYKAASFVLLVIYAFLIEHIQDNFLPWRAWDVYDAVAGIIGLVAVSFIKHEN